MQEKLDELKHRLREVYDLHGAAAVLNWDQSTYMPKRSAPIRARRLAYLQTLAQEKFTDPAIGKLLDDLQAYGESLPYESDDASLIRVTRREYEKQIKVPTTFTAEFGEHAANSFSIWAAARPENDFATVQPLLEKTLDYSRQYSEFFPGYDHIADPHIDRGNHGITTALVRELFGALRDELIKLLNAIKTQEQVEDSFLYRHFPKAQQYAFAREVAQQFGYDFERGRLDETHHPFETRLNWGDVRITTRGDDHHLGDGVFATMHETGHGLYEQGTHPDLDSSPLQSGTSSAVHESQSRLWENRIGRSRGFWEHYYPVLKDYFPGVLDDVSVDAFYRAINKVEPSLIRVKADEVTYNLHIMIRSELSIELLEGDLSIKELPDAWNARYERYLGVTPPDYSDGVMQDVHWYAMLIGGTFEGYTLGNILGAQYYEAVLAAHPEITDEITRGQFGTLHNWLKTNIYQHGSKFDTAELTERLTGGGISIEPLVRYLHTKFGDIYQL
ncbi:MAG: carboxypeptidase M32 [Chloroflexi bacterium]|nr:MAG: carboxypeptidase M32 [Chloroflexota bacterium]